MTRSAGGVFDAVKDLFTSPVFDGQQISIFSYNDRYIELDLPQWNNIPIYLFRAGPMLWSLKARNAVITSQADILHMVALWRYPHLFILDWRSNRTEPILCSVHGMLDSWIVKSQGRVKRLISKFLFDKALLAVDCFHALCQKELEDIRAYGLTQPVAIIPNGVNLPHNTLHTQRTDTKKHLLYLGRLHPKKGIDTLLRAIGTIRKNGNRAIENWVVEIVGWDHENSRERLEKIARSCSIEDIVTFHGGVFGEDKMRIYSMSDAYILPSHSEGLPMTILEAWSWRLPVIMTPQCNIPEGYEVGAAIQISPEIDSVVRGIEELFEMSQSERQAMGQRGYDLVVSQFTWDRSAEKMLELYRWLKFGGEKPEFVYE